MSGARAAGDSYRADRLPGEVRTGRRLRVNRTRAQTMEMNRPLAVSYTHLTLPTN